MHRRPIPGSAATRSRRRTAPVAAQPTRSATPCTAESLEGRLLFALASASGGSGYSGTLSVNPSVRKQQLICDPAEPLSGSTSVSYDARLVHLSAVAAGPGYGNDGFCAFVEVRPPAPAYSSNVGKSRAPPQTILQPLSDFLCAPAGEETGYVQVRYRLGGQAGQLCPPEGFQIVDEGGVNGVDTHALTFDLRPGVPVDAKDSYTVFAARAGTHGDNPEDFLVVNDANHTRLGPSDLTPATVTNNFVPPAPSGVGARLVPDPADPKKLALSVTGSDGPDVIRFDKVADGLRVRINGTAFGPFRGFGRVITDARGGDDDVQMTSQGSWSVLFFGGAGNDKLVAGNGSSVLVGGDGKDTLSGGNGGDVLIGGAGADTLSSGNGDDLLVAGSTAYDAASDAIARSLTGILAEWSGGKYETRIAHLTGASSGGLNGSALFRTSGAGRNVFDDGEADVLSGGSGRDWMLLKRSGTGGIDKSDLGGTETGTSL